MKKIQSAMRCSESWDVDWPGHRASLYHKRCRKKTTHPSGKCHIHRSHMMKADE